MRKLIGLALPLAFLSSVACGPSAGSGGDDTTGNPDSGIIHLGPDSGTIAPCTGASCPVVCTGGTSTKISGQIFVPKGDVPVPFARAYVPTSKSEFPMTVACEVCSSPQDPASVSTISDVNGKFTLDDIPVRPGDTMVEIAVQKGRFRKYIQVPITPCTAVNLTASPATAKLTLPKNKTEGSIPKIAIATGDWDAMECVIGQNGFGLDNTAFDRYDNLTHMISGGGQTFNISGGTTGTMGTLHDLLSNKTTLLSYNILFLNCSGDQLEAMYASDTTLKANMEAYVHSGGRLYVTDWSYDWIEQVPEFSKYITFNQGMAGSTTPEMNGASKTGVATDASGNPIPMPGQVVQQKLLDWLKAIEAILGAGSVVTQPDKVNIVHWLDEWVPMKAILAGTDGTKLWVQDAGNASGLQNRPFTVTFDYNKCGRVLYTSYHTLGRPESAMGSLPIAGDPFATATKWSEFPSYCSNMPLAAQERILEYLILEVSDCITIN